MRLLLAILAHFTAAGSVVDANLITEKEALWPRHVIPFEYGENLGEKFFLF